MSTTGESETKYIFVTGGVVSALGKGIVAASLGRLLKETDEEGVWRPKNLRSQPKALNKITYHYYPLLADAKTTEGREVDVTFRLALIAKLLGWPIEYD